MVEKRKKLHRDMMTEMLEQGKGRFLKSCIPYSADVENMGIYREPVNCFKPNSIASKSYQEIWSELKQLV
jgi:chromosome partitioning protein